MKTDLSDVAAAMKESGVPTPTINAVLEKLANVAKEEKDAKGPTERTKTQLIVLLDDPEEKFAGQAFLGWVLKLENDAPPQVALDRVLAAGRAYNESRKGKLTPVKSVREVFAGVPRRFFKDESEEKRTIPQTKEPVAILAVKGDLK